MKIGIIGLGLIGGSLLKVLSGKGHELFVVSSNPDTIKKAKIYAGFVSNQMTILSGCDLVFVCVPISKTLEILDELEKIVSENCIVSDVASVKEFVMQKKRPYSFIGSHPMAGTENRGFDASFKELFAGAKWVLTPFENTNKNDIEQLISVINLTDAEALIAQAKEHDLAVAMISHMPMLVAQGLYNAVKDNSLALKLASSGFRDMTRLAMTNTQLAVDMMNYNGKNIAIACDKLFESLNALQDKNYKEFISSISSQRAKMYSNDGKNILK